MVANSFEHIDKDTYQIQDELVMVTINTVPGACIDLKTPDNQYNPDNESCMWYYEHSSWPKRCIPSGVIKQLTSH